MQLCVRQLLIVEEHLILKRQMNATRVFHLKHSLALSVFVIVLRGKPLFAHRIATLHSAFARFSSSDRQGIATELWRETATDGRAASRSVALLS